ncbi:glutathione peroxidase [bacterium]|nr:glutathione peroxidase [bacterium]
MTIYDFKVDKRDGSQLDLHDLAGKVLLIVNTATGCGFTPQYKGLQALYERYHDQGLEILDFPCDQFGHQAPGSNDEIHEFCTLKYRTSFDQLAKIEVNGERQAPLYAYLKSQQGFGGFNLAGKILIPIVAKMDPHWKESPDIKWNFTKFVVDRHGQVVARFEPTIDPQAIVPTIEECLAK